MAKVMRGDRRVHDGLARMNRQRTRLTANLKGLRAMKADLEQALNAEEAKKSNADRKRVAQLNDGIVLIKRLDEDIDRTTNRVLNDRATEIIVQAYDEIQVVLAEIARDHSLVAVIAYPDAVSDEEKKDPHLKELKLKPPACQPLYLDESADYSDEIIRRLGVRYDARPAGR